jgi:hypothetical protein
VKRSSGLHTLLVSPSRGEASFFTRFCNIFGVLDETGSLFEEKPSEVIKPFPFSFLASVHGISRPSRRPSGHEACIGALVEEICPVFFLNFPHGFGASSVNAYAVTRWDFSREIYARFGRGRE